MRESFVFHMSFIESLPEERKDEFIKYTIEYGLYEQEPNLKGMDRAFWFTIKNRIDSDKGAYQDKLEYNALYNSYRQAIKNGDIPKDTSFKDFKDFKECKNLNNLNRNVKLEKTSPNSRRDIDIEYDNEFDIDIDNEYEFDIDAKTPLSRYCSAIFNILKENDLPCCKKNEITFMQTDFKNALAYLHSTAEYKHIHSDDVIGAVKNYASALKDPECYLTGKMNLYSLVKSKLFYNLLPANFDINSYKKFGASPATQAEESKNYDCNPCPQCGKKTMLYIQSKDSFKCDSCGKEVTYDEVMR